MTSQFANSFDGIDDDTIEGLQGDEIIVGANGNDLINGGEGNDTISGAALNETKMSTIGSGPFGQDTKYELVVQINCTISIYRRNGIVSLNPTFYRQAIADNEFLRF